MKPNTRQGRFLILAVTVGILLSTVGCTGTAYYGVSVGGPYGYPYGPGGGYRYGGGGYYGGVVVGHPF